MKFAFLNVGLVSSNGLHSSEERRDGFNMKRIGVVLLLLLQCACCVHSARHWRIDRGVDDVVCSAGYIVEPTSQNWPHRDLASRSSSGCCEETYGFIPCSTSLVGNLLLLAGYGYLMFESASLLTYGCEILLAVIGPGIIGGLILPIVGSLSHAAPILVSGLYGSKETAQAQVQIGMGLIAGSTVFLLTVLWGACLIVGKCDISEAYVAIDREDTRRFSLFGSGITTDKETTKASLIMVLSVIPLIFVELATIIHSSSGKRIVVLVACIAAVICLLSYCIYQISHPWIQKRQMAYAKHIHIISVILNVIHSKGWGKFIGEDGQPDDGAIESIFESLDGDHDGYLTINELRGLLVGLELHDPQISTADAINKVMTEFDSSKDCKLSRAEFKVGMASWLGIGTSTVGRSKSNIDSKKFWSDFQSTTNEKLKRKKEELEARQNADDEKVTEVDNPHKVYLQAVMLMLGGAIMTGIIADPLVKAVDNISDATSIPSFFISFIIMPLATTSSERVSALPYASRKKKRTASLTYSEIYRAVTMNNTLCVGVFLAIVYIRGLEWEFSAEVLVIVLVVLVMGLLSSFRTTFPLWMSFIAFLFYLLTLAMVYVLHYVLGWP